MASYRYLERITDPVLNEVVGGTTVASGEAITMTNMGSVCFQFNYGAGLNATFQILGSLDGVNFEDLNAVISPATGAAGTSIGNSDCGAFKYVKPQVTPTSGSATVTILAKAVTRP